MEKIIDIKVAKAARERAKYADLVMKVWDDWEHADKREMLDRKAEVQITAREKL
jgi:hypothetical protein